MICHIAFGGYMVRNMVFFQSIIQAKTFWSILILYVNVKVDNKISLSITWCFLHFWMGAGWSPPNNAGCGVVQGLRVVRDSPDWNEHFSVGHTDVFHATRVTCETTPNCIGQGIGLGEFEMALGGSNSSLTHANHVPLDS